MCPWKVCAGSYTCGFVYFTRIRKLRGWRVSYKRRVYGLLWYLRCYEGFAFLANQLRHFSWGYGLVLALVTSAGASVGQGLIAFLDPADLPSG